MSVTRQMAFRGERQAPNDELIRPESGGLFQTRAVFFLITFREKNKNKKISANSAAMNHLEQIIRSRCHLITITN